MTTSTSTSEIITTVTGIAAAALGVPAQALSPDVDLRAIEGIDSVKVLRMIARIEREYAVELSDEDVFSLTTIADTALAVQAALVEQTPAERA